MTYYPDPLVAVGLLILMWIIYIFESYIQGRGPDKGTTEYVKEQYVEGGIDHEELERRLSVLEDPEARRIRNAAERVSGIGEQTSWDIAAEFDRLDDVRAASEQELRQIPNVGEQRANGIKETMQND